MTITHVFAGIAVADRAASGQWYERLLGRAPDLIPNEQEAAWRLTETGWIYIVVDPERAGTGLHTLLVDDLDAFLGDVERRGIVVGHVETYENGTRRAGITDPDGNRLGVGQPPS
ncbi:MAG: VOC family protein [Solirubrobacteraceae bacterium]